MKWNAEDDKCGDYHIFDYTYDTEYIKNYILEHDYGNYILDDLNLYGYSLYDTSYIIINIEHLDYYQQHTSWLEAFKQLHRDYQLKGILA